jgi:hypothetical protein
MDVSMKKEHIFNISAHLFSFLTHILQLEAYRKRWGWWDEVYLLSGRQQQQCHRTDSKIRFERWSMARGVMAPALQLH